MRVVFPQPGCPLIKRFLLCFMFFRLFSKKSQMISYSWSRNWTCLGVNLQSNWSANLMRSSISALSSVVVFVSIADDLISWLFFLVIKSPGSWQILIIKLPLNFWNQWNNIIEDKNQNLIQMIKYLCIARFRIKFIVFKKYCSNLSIRIK